MRTQATRAISGRVNGDGTIAAAGPFTARRSAAGVYFLTFPGARVLTGTATNGAGQYGLINVDTFTTDGFRVTITNTAGTIQVDSAFTFTATVAA